MEQQLWELNSNTNSHEESWNVIDVNNSLAQEQFDMNLKSGRFELNQKVISSNNSQENWAIELMKGVFRKESCRTIFSWRYRNLK